ncbi:Probable mannose-6-phosphate isomerase ManA [Mycobacteroides abscessus subsp. bolletii]|uniref:mannose-6-phosphate isomerase n=1 Tax=Mycobacteroides abscessus subsp. bolletii TaxID=319705 RepID=A0A9Q7SB33_9MYCO|nr:mannose-6-phosphate isomerase, class I [Mycobacteroides abscessus]EHM16838.1 mannose-6-phosphate isomerase ManA [Mycobacteroides abscessus subsp. bolletii BD]MBN7302452.1 mannose-6-phosphate isomerase, class I [Mycobacteroides abscessus subsp. bolletii]MDO2972182.1 mannose-6-phosphate isomerase, class I [Mycobacteroides abscessus subsp. bolletii]MDO3068676.1 mannose-6-phosphate isomerase, class I [Mycobacteroides abscessus subsp. bolletii]MDO3077258.1 mannose-6-phosphate isomerase, class I 
MNLLRGAIRTYAWGSRTAIAEFTGRPTPTPHPEAELWLGAHPADPAYLETGGGAESLLEVVAADPAGQLGAASVAEFGDQLPFLLKVLAADEPLSLQAHPSAQQAADGFAREEAAGVPLNSPIRNYRDRNHKPELVVALDRFEALAGFRDPGDTVHLFRALDVEALTPYVNLLAGQSDADGLRALFTTWITLPQPSLDVLVPAVLDGAVRYLSSDDTRFVREARTLLELGERYPADAGVLASLLLNRLTLEPGEGIYLPAGNLHAYLRGLAVEIMANSDNVLRGGLTPKHVDVPELLRVLDFSPASEAHLHVETVTDGAQTRYRTPAREFALSRFDLADGEPTQVGIKGPRILLCTQGDVTLDGSGTALKVRAGQSVWVPADGGSVTLTGRSDARVFMATVDADA